MWHPQLARSNFRQLMQLHGMLLAVAFIGLMPTAVLLMRHR